MANIPRGKVVQTRTERTETAGKAFVIAAGAPKHYIPGYGVVGPGDIVTLAAGCEPGKWLIHVADSDVAKVQADPSMAAILAEKAAEKLPTEEAEQSQAAKDAAEVKLAEVGAAALAAAGGAVVTDATKDAEAQKLVDAAKGEGKGK